jgi:hypothetical protein
MPLTRLLRIGSRGDDVIEVQTMLNIIGAPFHFYGPNLPSKLPQLDMDGIFGGRTQARVWEFQNDRNLSPDAIVGPETYGTMRKMGVPDGVSPAFVGFFELQDFKRSFRKLLMFLFLRKLELQFPGPRETITLGP